MIGYLVEQELRYLPPAEIPVATPLTMIQVDPADPAFNDPTRFVGPVYEQQAADRLAKKKGWTFKRDGGSWCRVVPSPYPRRVLEIEPIAWLADHETVVICAGGGGIPTLPPAHPSGEIIGVEAVIDKDFASGHPIRSPDRPSGRDRLARWHRRPHERRCRYERSV